MTDDAGNQKIVNDLRERFSTLTASLKPADEPALTYAPRIRLKEESDAPDEIVE